MILAPFAYGVDPDLHVEPGTAFRDGRTSGDMTHGDIVELPTPDALNLRTVDPLLVEAGDYSSRQSGVSLERLDGIVNSEATS